MRLFSVGHREWNQIELFRVHSVGREFLMHVSARYQDGPEMRKPGVELRLAPVHLPHRSRMQSTAAPGIVQHETRRPKLASAWFNAGKTVTLPAAYTSSIVVVCEQHSGKAPE